MADITINLNRETGRIKPFHGVNNGPEGYGGLVDVSHYYRKAGIPLVRLHDPNWPHPWEIDIHTIFPDFSKDPSNAKNYDFSRSDTYIRKILDTGAKILFRLGESIEHTENKYYVHPPEDYEKWAQICIGIIQHYNHGWADGYEYGIEYWEIWNEPDGSGQRMWSGTDEQYYDLYRTVAPVIKRFDPELKVGGPAVTGENIKADFTHRFLKACKEENLPLDFYSWHTYTADPELIRSNCFFIREQLDQYGFRQTESIFNEWNYVIDMRFLFSTRNEYLKRELFERSKGPEGASFAAAVLMLLQDCPVDAANYYDGQPSALFCGLFDYYGVPQKTYFAFEAFNQVVQFPKRVEVGIDPSVQGVYCCSAKDDHGEAAVFISNFSAKTRFYQLEFLGFEKDQPFTCDEYKIDAERNLQIEKSEKINHGEISLLLPEHSVTLLKVNGNKGGYQRHVQR